MWKAGRDKRPGAWLESPSEGPEARSGLNSTSRQLLDALAGHPGTARCASGKQVILLGQHGSTRMPALMPSVALAGFRGTVRAACLFLCRSSSAALPRPLFLFRSSSAALPLPLFLCRSSSSALPLPLFLCCSLVADDDPYVSGGRLCTPFPIPYSLPSANIRPSRPAQVRSLSIPLI